MEVSKKMNEKEKELKELEEQEQWLVKKIRDFREGNNITIDKRFVEVEKELNKVRKRKKELEEEIGKETVQEAFTNKETSE